MFTSLSQKSWMSFCGTPGLAVVTCVMQSFIICCLSAELLCVVAPVLESAGAVVELGVCSWEAAFAGGGVCCATATPAAASAVKARAAENRFIRLLLSNVTARRLERSA